MRGLFNARQGAAAVIVACGCVVLPDVARGQFSDNFNTNSTANWERSLSVGGTGFLSAADGALSVGGIGALQAASPVAEIANSVYALPPIPPAGTPSESVDLRVTYRGSSGGTGLAFGFMPLAGQYDDRLTAVIDDGLLRIIASKNGTATTTFTSLPDFVPADGEQFRLALTATHVVLYRQSFIPVATVLHGLDRAAFHGGVRTFVGASGLPAGGAGASLIDEVRVTARAQSAASLKTTSPVSGDWSTTSLWNGNVSPNAAGAAVALGTATGGRQLTLSRTTTVGTLRLDAATAYGIKATGLGVLRLDVPAGEAVIRGAGAAHRIEAPVNLLDDTTIVAAGAAGATRLDFVGAVTGGSGITLSKEGEATAQVNVLEAGTIRVRQGVLRVAGVARTGAVDVPSTGGKLEVAGRLVVDYAAGGPSSAGAIAQLLSAGFAGQAGIVASPGAIGRGQGLALVDTAVGSIPSGLGGTYDNSTVVVLPAWLGDADLDGDVDTADGGLISLGGPASWGRGDFNHDGSVDFDDLSLFDYGSARYSVLGPGGMVPEPAGLSLVALAGALAAGRRRRA